MNWSGAQYVSRTTGSVDRSYCGAKVLHRLWANGRSRRQFPAIIVGGIIANQRSTCSSDEPLVGADCPLVRAHTVEAVDAVDVETISVAAELRVG